MNLRTLSPDQLLNAGNLPETVDSWQAFGRSLLTDEACTFHRNVEISAWYAWLYRLEPMCFKWAGMAALASHHIRLALAPLRSPGDRHGPADLLRAWPRQRLLLADTDVIRQTNNGIFDDIFWVHLAYTSSGHDMGYVRSLLEPLSYYDSMLSGFELIDSGRSRLLSGREDASSDGHREIWDGNLALLEHEQRSLVQPHFDRLSNGYARLISMGSATAFETRRVRDRAVFFTSFYASALGATLTSRSRRAPRITCFDDRWRWLNVSVIPRFQRFEARPDLNTSVYEGIFDQSDYFAARPCTLVRLGTKPHEGLRKPTRPVTSRTTRDPLVDLMAEDSFPGSDPPSTWAGP